MSLRRQLLAHGEFGSDLLQRDHPEVAPGIAAHPAGTQRARVGHLSDAAWVVAMNAAVVAANTPLHSQQVVTAKRSGSCHGTCAAMVAWRGRDYLMVRE